MSDGHPLGSRSMNHRYAQLPQVEQKFVLKQLLAELDQKGSVGREFYSKLLDSREKMMDTYRKNQAGREL